LIEDGFMIPTVDQLSAIGIVAEGKSLDLEI
jgi:hypothetical protein